MVYFALILNLKFYDKIIKSDDQNDADSLPQTMLTRKRKKNSSIFCRTDTEEIRPKCIEEEQEQNSFAIVV